MSKATVTRIFIGSVIGFIAGAVLAIAAVVLAFANDVFVMSGPDVVGIRGTAFAWSMLGVGVVGVLAVMGGLIAGLVSWIGALLNTSRLEDKTWFIVLLVLGLWNFGVIAMIAYVIAGPDGTQADPRPIAANPTRPVATGAQNP